MRIPAQHAQILVPGNTGDFHNIQPFLEQPGSGLVAQIVEPEILDTGAAPPSASAI